MANDPSPLTPKGRTQLIVDFVNLTDLVMRLTESPLVHAIVPSDEPQPGNPHRDAVVEALAKARRANEAAAEILASNPDYSRQQLAAEQATVNLLRLLKATPPGTDLSHLDWSDIDFRGTSLDLVPDLVLSHFCMTHGNFTRANFSGMLLEGIDLSCSLLAEARFEETQMAHAVLTCAAPT